MQSAGHATGAEPGKGHFQDALLGLGSVHAHFGHIQVCRTTSQHSCLQAATTIDLFGNVDILLLLFRCFLCSIEKLKLTCPS